MFYLDKWCFEQAGRAVFWTDRQCADALGVAKKTVQGWRLAGGAPAWAAGRLEALALGHTLPARWRDKGFYFEGDILVAGGRYYDTKKLLCVDEALWLLQHQAALTRDRVQQLKFRLD